MHQSGPLLPLSIHNVNILFVESDFVLIKQSVNYSIKSNIVITTIYFSRHKKRTINAQNVDGLVWWTW